MNISMIDNDNEILIASNAASIDSNYNSDNADRPAWRTLDLHAANAKNMLVSYLTGVTGIESGWNAFLRPTFLRSLCPSCVTLGLADYVDVTTSNLI